MQRFVFHLLFLCLFGLSACGTPSPTQPPPSSADLSGRLADWTLGEVSLRATFPKATVAQGKLSTDGSFNVNFNNAVPESALNDAPSCEGLEVSNPDAKLNTFSALSVLIDGEAKGIIALASSLGVVTEGLAKVGDFFVQYSYVDSDLSVKGSCPLSNPPATFNYDMTLKKGWNTVVFSLTSRNADGSQGLSMATEAVPAEASWFYRAP